MGALRARRDRRARLDDRRRGRRRRSERERDGGPRRAALRSRAASPAARTRRPRCRQVVLHPRLSRRRRRDRAPRAFLRSRPTDSKSPKKICACAGPASLPERSSPAPPNCGSATWCATSTIYRAGQSGRREDRRHRPALARPEHAGLRAALGTPPKHARAACFPREGSRPSPRIGGACVFENRRCRDCGGRSRLCLSWQFRGRRRRRDPRDALQRPAGDRRAQHARAGRHDDAQLRGRLRRAVDRRAGARDRTHDVPRQPTLSSSQLMDTVSITGGDFDADTQDAITQYFFTVPSQYLDIALRLERSRATGLLMSQIALESGTRCDHARSDAGQQQRDLPALREDADRLIGGTPYAKNTLGTVNGFAHDVNSENLLNFYDTWYHPNNAIVRDRRRRRRSVDDRQGQGAVRRSSRRQSFRRACR